MARGQTNPEGPDLPRKTTFLSTTKWFHILSSAGDFSGYLLTGGKACFHERSVGRRVPSRVLRTIPFCPEPDRASRSKARGLRRERAAWAKVLREGGWRRRESHTTTTGRKLQKECLGKEESKNHLAYNLDTAKWAIWVWNETPGNRYSDDARELRGPSPGWKALEDLWTKVREF